jgi:hypothetical protein
VRKQYRQWYEDNRANVSIVNEHEIERLRMQTGGRQNRPLDREDAYTMLVEYEHKARAAPRSNPTRAPAVNDEVGVSLSSLLSVRNHVGME